MTAHNYCTLLHKMLPARGTGAQDLCAAAVVPAFSRV